MLKKIIHIDGKPVAFRASAALPRLYRSSMGRDIFADLQHLTQSSQQSQEGGAPLDAKTLELFEDLAYLMAKHADPSIPDSPEQWLEGFGTFSIYQVLPQILELWGLNLQQDKEAEPGPKKRKRRRPRGH